MAIKWNSVLVQVYMQNRVTFLLKCWTSHTKTVEWTEDEQVHNKLYQKAEKNSTDIYINCSKSKQILLL